MLFIKALLAFLVLPCIVAGIIPVALAWLDPWRIGGFAIAYLTLGLGLVVLLRSVWDFYAAGKGTLAHWRPPEQIVTTGFYRHTRNPMYIGVLTIIGSLALLLGSLLLVGYLIVIGMIFHWHVVTREEPWLAQRFPEEWKRLRREVPRWFLSGNHD